MTRVAGTQQKIAVGGSGDRGGCLIQADGTIACWNSSGWRESDECGEMETIPPGRFVELTGVGLMGYCAVSVDGELYCWNGCSLGYETWPAYPVEPIETFQSIDSTEDFSCALDWDGAAYCWDTWGGEPLNTGYWGCGIGCDGGPLTWPSVLTKVVAGQQNACGIEPDGSPACWGAYTGTGIYDLIRTTTFPSSVIDIAMAAADGDHFYDSVCMLRTDGTIFCAGEPLGEFYPGSFYRESPLAWHSYPGVFESIEVSTNTICALDAGGYPTCWGLWADGVAEDPYHGDCSIPNWTDGGPATGECDGSPIGTVTGVVPIPDIPLQTVGCMLDGDVCCGIAMDGQPTCWGMVGTSQNMIPSLPEGFTHIPAWLSSE
jgi:hypothetical protein